MFLLLQVGLYQEFSNEIMSAFIKIEAPNIYFLHQPLITIFCSLLEQNPSKQFYSYSFLFLSSHYLLGFCPLIPLKLFMPVTCTLLKPVVNCWSSFYLTFQHHLIELTIISSLIHFLNLLSRISCTPTPRIIHSNFFDLLLLFFHPLNVRT